MPTLAELAQMNDNAYVGYPQLQRQANKMRLAQMGRIPENLADPRTYGFVRGLTGTSPDELGMSVLSPNTAPAKDAAYYGYQLSNLGQMSPAIAPASKALLRTAGNAVNDAMVYGTGPLARITPQPMFAVNPMDRGIVREGNPIQSAVVLIGDKIYTGRTHGDALNRAVYEGAVRKEGGKYIYPKDAEVNHDLFMTKDGQIIDRLQASRMLDIGASETAIEKGLMQNNPARSMTVDSYMEQAKALKEKNIQSKEDYSYRSSHKAPSPDFGAPLHDLTGGGQMYPSDVYSSSASRIYGTGYPKADREAFNLAKQVRGNPNAEVTMYRAVPKDEKIKSINKGDWVTLSKSYAQNHGESVLGNDYKIISQKVKAKDLWTNADSIHEFGYHPSND